MTEVLLSCKICSQEVINMNSTFNKINTADSFGRCNGIKEGINEEDNKIV